VRSPRVRGLLCRSEGQRRWDRIGFLSAAVVLAALATGAAAAPPKVEITGGHNPAAHSYVYMVSNRSDSPIVGVEFPHYRADTFTAPEGWQTASTFLVNVGVPDKPGVCKAFVERPSQGIPSNAKAEFALRIAPDGEQPVPASGEVVVRFADGSETTVADVEVPRPRQSRYQQLFEILGLGLLVAVWLGVRAILHRRRRRGEPVETASGSGDEPADAPVP